VAQPTDESNATTLPDPELNPLLNPLLAAHMGRWAEVYFTSPPEKRAQAVSELVRELASNPTPEPGPSQCDRDEDKRVWGKVNDEADEILPQKSDDVPGQAAPIYESADSESVGYESTIGESMMRESVMRESVTRESLTREPMMHEPTTGESVICESMICESCGYKNAQQRFCGMCGRPLAISLQNPSQRFAAAEPDAAATWDESDTRGGEALEVEPESAADSIPGSEYQQIPQNLRWSTAEHNLAEFRALSDDESDPTSHGYRMYVGVAVVILVALLVYMTWRSNAVFRSGSAASAPSAAMPAKSETAVVPENVPPQSDLKALTPPVGAPAAFAAQNAPGETGLGATRRVDRSARVRPASRTVPAIANPATSAAKENGAEELAAAEKYLDAAPGSARDSRQAATWLWKAVAKQNSTATLLLSDLYLRGDGVTKSCDQARLLLDAAARKGATAAAERLRNLQAFGCR
jgi:hypothetical protein